MTPSDFRAAFPAFANTTSYPDQQVQFWLEAGARLVNVDRWGTMTNTGIGLVTAHYLTMGALGMRGASAGGGPVSSKAVDKVSVSYDTSIGSVEGAGEWNSSLYGRQYAQLCMIYGAGGIQL